MHLKLIICFVEESKTDAVMKAAREGGAKGSTLLTMSVVRDLNKVKPFLV